MGQKWLSSRIKGFLQGSIRTYKLHNMARSLYDASLDKEVDDVLTTAIGTYCKTGKYNKTEIPLTV